jgi:hypothetical protein
MWPEMTENGGRIPELRFSGGISPTLAEVQTSGAGVGGATGVLRSISGDNTLTITNQLTMRTGVGSTTLYSDAGTFTINTPLVTANATNRALILAGPGDGVINAVIANGTTANLPVTKTAPAPGRSTAPTPTPAPPPSTKARSRSARPRSVIRRRRHRRRSRARPELHRHRPRRFAHHQWRGEANGVYNAATDPDFITGTGSIRVGPEPSGYATWAAGHPFCRRCQRRPGRRSGCRWHQQPARIRLRRHPGRPRRK